jgi:hypothetical protein
MDNRHEINLPGNAGVVFLSDEQYSALVKACREIAKPNVFIKGGALIVGDPKWKPEPCPYEFKEDGGAGPGSHWRPKGDRGERGQYEYGTRSRLPRKHPGLAENPKDALGTAKPSLSSVPTQVLFEIGAGMLEGACKYARHNYRVADIRASVYYDAALRHIMAWWEGEDIDPDSGVHHIGKALACLAVLRDCQMNDKVIDDRPPRAHAGWMAEIQKLIDAVRERHPNPLAPFTQKGLDRAAQRGILEEEDDTVLIPDPS